MKRPNPIPFIFILMLFTHQLAQGGPYSDSAHGNSTSGVNRSATDTLGYARGNCAHCHEQHGVIAGEEPAPVDGAPSSFLLMSNNFSDISSGPYSESNNFCFNCHVNLGGVQSEGGICNLQYSDTFGCGTSSDANGIMEAFNLNSYHNLNDIKTFYNSELALPSNLTNPCVACHNPHRAKRNKADPDNPADSVLSKPTDHENLWLQSMDTTFNTFYQEYEPPYCTSSANREPDASISATTGAENTPDYVTFCTECHNSTNTIYSTNFGRDLHNIDWSATGDKHGMLGRDVSAGVLYKPLFIAHPERPPYATTFMNDGSGYTAVTSHNVLSCMDCHEPHGAVNMALIRSRVNSEELAGNITSTDFYNPSYDINVHNKEMGYLCQKCHKDDSLLGGTQVNGWRWVHHKIPDAPYPNPGDCGNCNVCHGSVTSMGITCSFCHFHGSDDSWMDSLCPSFTTSRRTF